MEVERVGVGPSEVPGWQCVSMKQLCWSREGDVGLKITTARDEGPWMWTQGTVSPGSRGQFSGWRACSCRSLWSMSPFSEPHPVLCLWRPQHRLLETSSWYLQLQLSAASSPPQRLPWACWQKDCECSDSRLGEGCWCPRRTLGALLCLPQRIQVKKQWWTWLGSICCHWLL